MEIYALLVFIKETLIKVAFLKDISFLFVFINK